MSKSKTFKPKMLPRPKTPPKPKAAPRETDWNNFAQHSVKLGKKRS